MLTESPVTSRCMANPEHSSPHGYPTDYVRLMTKAAVEAVDRVFRPGFKFSKSEVLLLGLCQKGEFTDDLFAISQPVATEKVMGVLDSINERWGRGNTALGERADQSSLGDAPGNDESELYDSS